MERSDVDRAAWLRRRLSFGGLTVGALGELVQPSSGDVASPWANVDLPAVLDRESAPLVVDAWLEHLAAPTTSISKWMTWFWHDHFAISAPVVTALELFTGHIHLLQDRGLGSFKTLLRDVTIDPAMLIFLDGRRSRSGAVNENYGRELLELYGLGIGNYDEDDVRAAAVALTGWVVDREQGDARFVRFRHDDTPQKLLGRDVDDVDSTISAVVGQPACADHVTRRLAMAILGTELPQSHHDSTAERFRQSGYEISALAIDIISQGLDENLDVPIVLAPVQWLLQSQSITGTTLEPQHRVALLRQMGQMPGVPPNVGGYPGADTWAGPSTMIGRFRAASVIAALAPEDSEALDAAREKRWEELAVLANRPNGFSAETMEALNSSNTSRRRGREALAAALMSPELAVA